MSDIESSCCLSILLCDKMCHLLFPLYDTKEVFPKMDYSIRKAVLGDLSDITLIYNQGIEDGIATLETDLRDEEERKTWFLSRSPRHQVLVIADETNTVLGWASLNVFNTRVCYDGVADVSIYIRRDLRGQGLGKRLLDALSEEAKKQGFHKLVLAALNENEYGK